MAQIFFTSDTHFFHKQSFLYAPRGFTNEIDMNTAIVERWNSVVSPADTVYHLGDVVMNNYDISILNKLNGNIFFIRGNHDTENKIADIESTDTPSARRIVLGTSEMLRYNRLHILLSHYPTLTANYDEKHFNQHVFNFHGHTHQQTNWLFPDNPFIYHVGMDSHDCYPIALETIIDEIRTKYIHK